MIHLRRLFYGLKQLSFILLLMGVPTGLVIAVVVRPKLLWGIIPVILLVLAYALGLDFEKPCE